MKHPSPTACLYVLTSLIPQARRGLQVFTAILDSQIIADNLVDVLRPNVSHSIRQSDVAIFNGVGFDLAMWVNDTGRVMSRMHGTASDSPLLPRILANEFPFARLATVHTPDHAATFLYHQMNGTTFAEEQWSATLHDWVPTVYISVSDS